MPATYRHTQLPIQCKNVTITRSAVDNHRTFVLISRVLEQELSTEEDTMAIARMEPVYTRRYSPAGLRGAPVERRFRTPRRALAVGCLLAGGALQHVLATMPAEPQPAPLAVAGLVSAPAAAAHSSGVVAQPVRVQAAAAGTARVAAPPRHRPLAAARPAPSAARRPAVSVRALHVSALLPPPGASGDAARTAMLANPQGVIRHLPSVSVAAIRAALRAAGSPLLDTTYADGKDAAEYLWDSGRVLGIDPAVVMAIFKYESAYGTRGVARLTYSVGNIRPLAGQPSFEGYRLYSSWEEGIDDCYRLLRRYAGAGADSVSLAIPTWAPAGDNNDPGAYVDAVLNIMSSLYSASAPA